MLYGNAKLTGVERKFDQREIIVSKTDLTGKITYGNNTFYKLADMTEKDCLNVQHNVVRHPDMPRTVFEYLWKSLKSGEEIFAYVVNRAKNGDHYWVLAHITPSRDSDGNIVGYHSNRSAPNRQLIDEKIKPLYKELKALEEKASSPKQGLQGGVKHLEELLAARKMTFNEMIFAMGV
ncbi:PAS domain-containing protein [Curvivirga aplysinae]|uniref:PAS domain-containing protein n=1 Tax=Curvivirga aplysinae TaxID=2529852 RepID=UPI0012BBF2BB|nr:PAS domain-containing protein [Curvivirga aplysinae]MTI10444.1 PAS domain-containing protein [Curvivirga aplysinae]